MSKKSENFAKILNNLLEKNNMSQRELASRLGTAPSAISNYITGTRLPRFETITAIANIFNVTTDYLLGIIPNEEPIGYTIDDTSVIQIPLLKTIRSKDSIFNTPDNIIEELYIAKYKCKNPDKTFAVKVKSQDMYPRIYDGDIVICEELPSNEKVYDGDICIITIGDNEAICREVTRADNGYVFNPYNTKMPPTFYSDEEMRISNIRIVGRVLKILVDLPDKSI